MSEGMRGRMSMAGKELGTAEGPMRRRGKVLSSEGGGRVFVWSITIDSWLSANSRRNRLEMAGFSSSDAGENSQCAERPLSMCVSICVFLCNQTKRTKQ